MMKTKWNGEVGGVTTLSTGSPFSLGTGGVTGQARPFWETSTNPSRGLSFLFVVVLYCCILDLSSLLIGLKELR